jgi:SAM-dependent methyltransferase
MEINDWNERYLSRERAAEDLDAAPTPLLLRMASNLAPGKALDLACGAGRNSLWLAERKWEVTAVDGASAAIQSLQSRAAERSLRISTIVADMEKGEFEIEPSRWDLIAICYYLPGNLFEPAKRGVVPGGLMISIVHITEPDEEESPYRLRPGQLEKYFTGWEILHYHEGKANDAAHRRAVAEIVARKPVQSQFKNKRYLLSVSAIALPTTCVLALPPRSDVRNSGLVRTSSMARSIAAAAAGSPK